MNTQDALDGGGTFQTAWVGERVRVQWLLGRAEIDGVGPACIF